MTQQNAAMVEQATAAARSLASEAERLNDLVSQFQLSGGNSPARHQQTTPSTSAYDAGPKRIQAAKLRGNLAVRTEAQQDWSDF
jgi:methyl-accepting chemotaxis protein